MSQVRSVVVLLDMTWFSDPAVVHPSYRGRAAEQLIKTWKGGASGTYHPGYQKKHTVNTCKPETFFCRLLIDFAQP
jgi:hypothetical protein